ncbi:MAG: hypothetical protein ACK5CA_00915 [Cyanobacteriota bacterium]|jgi:hypothetical protein
MVSLPQTFRLSPLIRLTLINLYLALTVPLPLLAWKTGAAVSPLWLGLGLLGGLFLLGAALGEKVEVNEEGLGVSYPPWAPFFSQRGWRLTWEKIAALKCRSTGQGGLVYYLLTAEADRAYLLPMRIAGFNRLTQIIQAKTALDLTDVRPLAQPWMYAALLGLTVLLWGIEALSLAPLL